MEDGEDDARAVELSALQAIFPEMVVDADDPFAFALDVPVNPAAAVTVAFPAAGGDAAAADAAAAPAAQPAAAFDTHQLAYLPAVRLHIALPQGYPAQAPPRTQASADPPWLPAAVLDRLGGDGARVWAAIGREPAVFHYIDHVQAAADRAFDLEGADGFLALDTQHKVAILDYDVKARQAAFDRQTFRCGVCLDPKNGAVCHRMQACQHVFCVQCLRDFYSAAIASGDLATVRCLEPGCAKTRAGPVAISPGELLQIVDEALVRRYISLSYKTELERDKNTVYCPRTWCSGAARSTRHRKPEGFTLYGGRADQEKKEKAEKAEKEERLAVCDDCGFAFCSRCLLSWHGDFVACSAPRTAAELTAEEQASLDFLARHTTPCPTCAAKVQKTMGCNHMICFRCNTHFCYLCSAWLDPQNPYAHFGQAPDGRRTACFNRLWELEGGDEGGAGVGPDLGHALGGRGGAAPGGGAGAAAPPAQPLRGGRPRGRAARQPPARMQQVDVAREGPLVLRIALEPEAEAAAEAAPNRVGGEAQRVRGFRPVGARGGRRGRGRGGRGRGGVGGVGVGGQGRGLGPGHGLGHLDPHMEAWVRNFVELALVDNEDLLDDFDFGGH